MKKNWLIGVFLLLFVTASAQETVSSVSFNPARLGTLEKVKVSGSVKLLGGLSATSLNLGGLATETVCAEDAAGNDIMVTACKTYNLDGTCAETLTTCVAQGQVQGSTVRIENPFGKDFTLGSLSVNPSNSNFNASYSVNMPNTMFRAGTGTSASLASYSISNTPSSSNLLNLTMTGGDTRFQNGDSFVNNLASNYNVFAYAKNWKTNGVLSITGFDGTEDFSPRLIDENGQEQSLQGPLQLGNIAIPSASSAEYRRSINNSFVSTVSLNLSSSSCQLNWVKRKVTPASSSAQPQAVYVLALTNCSPTCVPSDPVQSIVYDECPTGYTGQKYHHVLTETVCVSAEGSSEQYAQTNVSYCNSTYTDCRNSAFAWVNQCVANTPRWELEDEVASYSYKSVYLWNNTDIASTPCRGLEIGDTSTLSIGSLSIWAILNTGFASINATDHWYDTYSSIFNKRVYTNRVSYLTQGVERFKERTGDIISDAPACTTSNNGSVIEHTVYVLQPMPNRSVPVRCSTLGRTARYRCHAP